MSQLQEILQWQEMSGTPVAVGDVTITPQSRVLTFRSRFGGFVWNRPTAVLVERGGKTERLPIVDVTRAILLGLAGLSLLVTIFVRSNRERRH
jgi:hypothetical protein